MSSARKQWLIKIDGRWLAGLLGSLVAVAPGRPAAAEKATLPVLDHDPHLAAWWTFDETSGRTAADSSPHKRHATLRDDLSFDTQSAPGRVGNALKLEGKDEGVRVPGFKGVTGPQARTVAVWLKTASASGEIVSWGSDEHGQMWTLGHIRSRIGVTPKGGYLYMKAATHDDAWHHVAAVVEPASPPNLHDHVKLYRDGVLAEIDDIGLLDLWPIETGDTLEVRIGRRFKGLLDDLRIYDRALSEEEVQALFKLQPQRPSTQPP